MEENAGKGREDGCVEEIKLKRDSYRAERGGTAKLIDIMCSKCDAKVLLYQKDGPGWLKRCYLNRIFGPEEYERLQHDKAIREPRDMQSLKCPKCMSVLGTPMRHKDGRLAFAIIPGSFKRKINKDIKYK